MTDLQKTAIAALIAVVIGILFFAAVVNKPNPPKTKIIPIYDVTGSDIVGTCVFTPQAFLDDGIKCYLLLGEKRGKP